MRNWFVDDCEQAALAGTYCRHCRRTFFPVKRFCPMCLETHTVEMRPLTRKGTLHSFTVAYSGPSGFSPPYALGYVDLPEGVRIFSMLQDCGPFGEQLRIGQTMEVVRHGAEYRFRPCQE